MSTVVSRALKTLGNQTARKHLPRYQRLCKRLESGGEHFAKFTTPELVLYLELLRRDIRATHHRRIRGQYEADIWCPILKTDGTPFTSSGLDVECDGAFWHERPATRRKDRRRDLDLAEWHIVTLRFDSERIENDVTDCANEIAKVHRALTEDPSALTNSAVLQSIVRKQWMARRRNIG